MSEGSPAAMNYLGYRWWRVTQDESGLHLRSVVQPWEWPIGGIAQAVHFNYYALSSHIAKADLRLPHRAPMERCTCGIYAWRELSEAMIGLNGLVFVGHHDGVTATRAFVLGAVLTGGRVVHHQDEGLRAEQARPVAMGIWEHQDPHPLVREIAGRMGLPLMTYGNLERFCTEFGDRQPAPSPRKEES